MPDFIPPTLQPQQSLSKPCWPCHVEDFTGSHLQERTCNFVQC